MCVTGVTDHRTGDAHQYTVTFQCKYVDPMTRITQQ